MKTIPIGSRRELFIDPYLDYLRTGAHPFPFAETVELMQRVIAGIRSREEGGREVEIET